jgi:hypothetical protein
MIFSSRWMPSLLPLVICGLRPPTAACLALGASVPIAVAVASRWHGAVEALVVAGTSLLLFPVAGHVLAWAHRRITHEGWGRVRSWLLAVPLAGLLLVPAAGIDEGPGDARWWAKLLALGLAAVAVVLGLSSAPDRADTRSASGFAAGCALAFVASGALWLAAFWPAVMSVDSVIQWQQLATGRYDNVHPAFHTGFMWLVSRIGPMPSPAPVAMAQILLLGFALWLCLAELARWGVPRGVLALVTVLFTVLPANGLLAVTLWKDVPYTALMMILGAQLLAVGRTGGEVLRSWGFLVRLSLVTAAVCLLRHNGMVAVVLLGAFLPFTVPRAHRIRAIAPAVVGLLLFGIVAGPVYRTLDVQPADPAFVSAIPIHHVGAIARARPDTFSPEDRAFLEEVAPLATWQDKYFCYSVVPLLYEAKLDTKRFAQSQPDFLRRWLGWAVQNPRVLLKHQACVSAIVWDVRRRGGFVYLFERQIVPNSSGLSQSPKAPQLRAVLERYLDFSTARGQIWWMWGTGLFLYLGIAAALAASLRSRTWSPLMFVLPAVLSAGSIALVSVAQDFRFMYPMYTVGLLALALPFGRAGGRRAPGAASPAGGSPLKTETV